MSGKPKVLILKSILTADPANVQYHQLIPPTIDLITPTYQGEMNDVSNIFFK